MTDHPPHIFQDNWAQPLLNLTLPEHPPTVQLAALTAALNFPLSAHSARTISTRLWRLATDANLSTAVRHEAINLSAAIPRVSVREQLRQLASNPEAPDQMVAARALQEVGDPSQVPALLQRAAQGMEDSFRLLARAPLESVLTSAEHLTPYPDHAMQDTRFWRAMCLGRLQHFEALDDVFGISAPVPQLFWGSPWTAWTQVSAIRPCPPHLVRALERRLHHSLETDFGEMLGHELLRALQITTWAASGVADAQGDPLLDPAFGPVLAPPEFQSQDALMPWLRAQLAGARPRLDDAQVAWSIAHTPTDQLIRETVDLTRQVFSTAAKVRLLHILALAADCQSGQAGSPYRGDGGAGMRLRPNGELVDDRTEPRSRPVLPVHRLEPPHPATPSAFPAHPSAPAPPTPAPSPPRKNGFRGITIDTRNVEYETETRVFSRSPAAFEPPQPAAPAPRGVPRMTESAPLAGAVPPSTDDADTSTTTTAASATSPEIEENRRVRARLLHQDQPRTTFLAGATHTVRCWIGLPDDTDGATSADQPVPGVAIPEEGLLLTAELLWNDQSARQTLLLPATRTARSSECEFSLQVAPDERYVSADLVLRYQGRVFEAVKLEAAVLADGETASARDMLRIRVQLARREVLALQDAQPCATTLMLGDAPRDAADGPAHPQASTGERPTLRVFGTQGARNYALEPPEQAIHNLSANIFNTEKSLVRRRAATPDAPAQLDTQDEEVRILLRDLARFGSYFFNRLSAQGFEDPGERIQLLSLDPNVVLPLELVYDKGNPSEAATLCPGWHTFLDTDAVVCPHCGTQSLINDDTGLAQVICPSGFWSLSKVIERLNPDCANAASAPRQERRTLPALNSAVFAASDKVPSDLRTKTWLTLKSGVGEAVQALSWPDWRKAMRQHPRLLVALPHHDSETLEDFIEIGSADAGPDLARLRRGQITAAYVNPDGVDPGPILLLLGCSTGARSELGFEQLTREFQRLKTAIVLGTLAQILGRHAAPLASALIEQLLDVKDDTADFGTLMRQVRRRMLARGYLLSLCLVAVGDAQWRLSPLR